ncbi:peptidoglycan DD-metalloendopeptidase family protein [Clostridium gasigenes]|uniref:M23 family metallopeptidase n=1 Tax=Clostridium gasigenes TaxID=94869 RepID=UPI0016275258|nr:M23 family metallopeptidase [Clostridium gasigenes]MBB6624954.1 peptidoglycan DD-metalloendopeptidase family protein [Clostridium gasigenes]
MKGENMVSKKDIVSASIQLALSILLPLLIIIVVDGKFNNLEAYIDGKIIGYVESRGETVKVYNELITTIGTEYKNVDIEKNKVEFKKIKDDTILLSNKQEIEKGILGSINGKARAFELKISGKNFGYINSDKNVNDVLKLVTDKYIESLDIVKEDLISVDIECKIDVEETTINIADVKTQDEISNEIYKTSINEDGLLNIDIKVKEIVEEEILADTITVNDDTMYLGQIEEKTGKSGKKIVSKEVVYSNCEVSYSNVLKEEVLASAQNTVVHRGSKNPYDDGIAFLSRPTRGGFTTSDYGARWESFHKGIDIAGNVGDDVMAAIDGEVTYAQYNDGGYGNLIMIKHADEMVTYYAHLSNIHVSVGDKVEKGNVIGLVGNTGFSTGPHLHFELRVGGKAVNPSEYLMG